MGDPRLNSLHLDPLRRQDFRRAKEVLLQARGCETLYAERQRDDSANTLIRSPGGKDPPDHLDYWLRDGDFVYPLKVGLNTLGRSADNDLVVEDLYISRRHCAILVHHDGACVLHDMSSKNGTFLNGVKIGGPTPLRPGDEIRICNRQFTFLTRAHASARPACPPTQTICE